MKQLDLSPFKNALDSLNSIIERYEREGDIDIRDGMIQRFEYTYSLAIKMLVKFINYQSNDIIPNMTFNETIRIANKLDLLSENLEKWTVYRQNRNLTSHTYDENVAQQVVSIIPEFKKEAMFLYRKMKEKL